MFNWFKKKKPPVLGLDISSTTIKLLELSRSDIGFKVEKYAVTPLPAGAVVEKSITDVEAVAATIQKAIARSRTKLKEAAVAVTGSAVITKIIELDRNLSDEAMENQINIEADQYIPYPLDEVAIDFTVIGDSEKRPEMAEVMLVACRRENVDLRVDALEQAELKPRIVDVEANALERAFVLIKPSLVGYDDKHTVAIFDVGATMATLSVLVGGETVYTREQLFGGKQLTEEVQRRYGLSAEEAGLAKKRGGLPDDYETEVLEPFKEAVVQQLIRSLQFFYSSSQYNAVDFIVMAGGVSSMPNIQDVVAEKLDTVTIVADPFEHMAVASDVDAQSLHDDAPALLIACGLAMRSFDDA